MPIKPWLLSVSRCFWASIACLSISHAAQSESPWMVRVWTRDGLTNRTIGTVSQAPDGFLWVTTADRLARFDGQRFQEFSLSDFGPIENHRVHVLLRAHDGHIWLATDGDEVVRLGIGAPLVIRSGLPKGSIQSMVEARDGSLWLSYVEGPLCHIENGRVAWAGLPAGFNVSRADAARCLLTVDNAGTIWVCQGGHLGILQGTNVAMWNRHAVPSSRITAARDGGVWLVASNGIYHVGEDGHFERLDGISGPRFGAMPNTVLEDHTGALWIGTLTDGLFRFAPNGSLDQIATSFPEIDALTEDNEGNIWAGTGGGGLDRVTPRAIAFEGGATGLPQQTIQSLCEDAHGTLWASTQNGTLVQRTPEGTWETKSGWPTSVTSLTFDAKGDLWIGSTDRALYRMHGGTIDAWHSDDGITSHTVNLIAVGKDGTIWAAGERPSSFMRIRNGRLDTLPLPRKSLRIESLGVDPSGQIWIGCLGGTLLRVEGDRVVNVTPSHSPHHSIRGMEFEPNGTVWLAYSGGGLARLRGTEYVRITADNGLYSDSISHLAMDDRGWMWFGGQDGVFKIRLKMLTDFADHRLARVQSVHFGADDELPNLQVTNKSWGGALRTHDGRIWIPMGPALVIADPSRSRESQSAPTVFITQVSVDNRVEAEYRGVLDHLRVHAKATVLPRREVLALPPVQQRLEFQFAGLSFSAPENVRYRYRLEPFDDGWVSSGGERSASYVRLPPGAYVFHVQASNGDGVWNNAAQPLAVTVAPFFWQTWWFRVGVAGAVACLAYSIFRWRVRRIRRRAAELKTQNLELERRIAERTAALAKSLDALKASEYFYHSLVESLPQAIVRKDTEGRITYANSGFAELVGQPLETLVGRRESELYPADLAAKMEQNDRHVLETRQPAQSESVLENPGAPKRYLHVKKVPLYDSAGKPIGVQVLFWDWTVLRQTEENLKEAQRELLEASRYAGMAEVATGVLHNIGNALNSVNVSATVAGQRVGNLKPESLTRVAELLAAQGDRLGEFLTQDTRGRKLPDYLHQLAQHLIEESAAAAQEIRTLRAGVEHVKEIVAAQQDFARASDLLEAIPPAELIEYALQINAAAIARHEITVLREYAAVPPVRVQRQKALQILVNLLNNAKDAMEDVPAAQRRITVALRPGPDGQAEIAVTDNGKGIAPENLTRIFNFGFTTKKTGHGFGLHSSANSAREMDGMLTVSSEGIDRGATFVLSVPTAVTEPALEPVGSV